MHNLKYFGICAVFVLSTNTFAEPLVTITCDKPEGFSIAYESTKPIVKGPTKDGYRGRPTFVIDANKKNMAISWTQLPEDPELKRQAKEAGLSQLPPVPAADCEVVQFYKEHISAIRVDPWSIMTFSFFPTISTALISQQFIQLGSKDTFQSVSFAHCEFSWATPQ